MYWKHKTANQVDTAIIKRGYQMYWWNNLYIKFSNHLLSILHSHVLSNAQNNRRIGENAKCFRFSEPPRYQSCVGLSFLLIACANLPWLAVLHTSNSLTVYLWKYCSLWVRVGLGKMFSIHPIAGKLLVVFGWYVGILKRFNLAETITDISLALATYYSYPIINVVLPKIRIDCLLFSPFGHARQCKQHILLCYLALSVYDILLPSSLNIDNIIDIL